MKHYLGYGVTAMVCLTVGLLTGLGIGASATEAAKDALVEVSEEHVDAGASRLSRWADAAEDAAAKKYQELEEGEPEPTVQCVEIRG